MCTALEELDASKCTALIDIAALDGWDSLQDRALHLRGTEHRAVARRRSGGCAATLQRLKLTECWQLDVAGSCEGGASRLASFGATTLQLRACAQCVRL